MEPTPQSPHPPGLASGSVRGAATLSTQLRLFDPDGGKPRWLRLAQRAWRLIVSGDTTLASWADPAVEAVWARYGNNERTAATVTAEIRRLFRCRRP